KANDRLSAWRDGGTAVKVQLGRNAAVELAVELIRADLTGEVYRQSLRQGDHFVVLGHDRWICHIFDRAELEHRVCIDEFIQLPVAKTEARHNLPVVQSLVTPVTTPRWIKSSTGLVMTLEWMPRSFLWWRYRSASLQKRPRSVWMVEPSSMISETYCAILWAISSSGACLYSVTGASTGTIAASLSTCRKLSPSVRGMLAFISAMIVSVRFSTPAAISTDMPRLT